MATRTITAMFDSRAEAEQAIQSLVSEAGLSRSAARVVDQGSGTAGGATTASTGTEDKGLFASLRDLFIPDEDRHSYAEGMRRGGVMVSAQVEDAQMDRAMDVLERHGAVDLDEREASWRKEGWAGYTGAAAAGTGVAAATTATTAATAQTGTAAAQGGEAIPIVEEQIRIGKREVDRGRVRVRSYVVETPVQEQVALRQEHVEVERRTVDRPVTDADRLFQERTIEATESGEEAVVAKEARVVEEVVVRKEAEERVQTVQDSVRRTEVEVEDERRAVGTTTGTTTTGTTTTGTTTGKPGPDRS